MVQVFGNWLLGISVIIVFIYYGPSLREVCIGHFSNVFFHMFYIVPVFMRCIIVFIIFIIIYVTIIYAEVDQLAILAIIRVLRLGNILIEQSLKARVDHLAISTIIRVRWLYNILMNHALKI